MPVNQVHGFVRDPCGHLHRHAIAQQLVGAQVGLVQGDAGYISSGLQLLQRLCYVCRRITALLQIGAQQIHFNGAVALALAPIA